MQEKIQEIPGEQWIIDMFKFAFAPIMEKEYKLLGISKFNVLKRRKFRNVYRTLIIYLIKLAIPEAFPENSSEVLGNYDKFFQIFCENRQTWKKETEARLKEFDGLVNWQADLPFLELGLYATELVGHTSKKYLHAANFSDWIENLYLGFAEVRTETEVQE